MADETQTTSVAGVENNATQQEEKKLYVYYYSDPNAATKELRFHEIYADIPFNKLPWHVHTEKPDEGLQDPVWDNQINGWVENSKNGQAQILAEAQTKIENLMEVNKKLQKNDTEKNQVITDLQRTIQQSNQATAALGQQFNTFGTQMTKAMKEVTTAINDMKKTEGSDK